MGITPIQIYELQFDQKMKKIKYEKTKIIAGIRGSKGGQGWEMHCNAFFVFVKQIFCWHLFF